MAIEYPIIAYNNLLRGAGYTMIAGTDEPAAPLSDAWSWDMSRPALPIADANGTLSFSVNTPAGVGYGVDVNGNYVQYGAIATYGGKEVADTMILGAARNNPGGVRFSGGTLTVLADGVQIFNQTIYAPQNASAFYRLPIHNAATTYTITITGITASATVRLPEIFIGTSLVMPALELGHNWYGETFQSTNFKAATGRVLRSRRYVRIEQALRWRYLVGTQRTDVQRFVESALESLQPFWFLAFPDSAPTNCYMGFHDAYSAPMPMTVANIIDTFSLKFVEKL